MVATLLTQFFPVNGAHASGVTTFSVLALPRETYVIAPSLPKGSTLQLYPVSKSVAIDELRCMVCP